MNNYAIEKYAGGFIVADYSGKRGIHGAAYAGTDGEWKNQAIVDCPFPTDESARVFADANVPPDEDDG